MAIRRTAAVTLASLAWFGLPTGVAEGAASTVRLAILHVVRGCHVWDASNKPTATVRIRAGGRVVIRTSCPMDFDFRQVSGPKLSLGDARTHAGTTRTIVFKRAGTYKLLVHNVQMPEDVGLETLGVNDTLRLTVVVAPRS
jgi:hypothetical protein